MSRAQQDQFIDDDEDEVCPLCVEELDLSDKDFRPCPCGYQICQFCFNNIKTTMNGLCPACRRPYDDKNIVFKTYTPEELANYRAEVHKNAKKKAAAAQKEAQKKQADELNRKHLSGMRVVQKNLVYVTGLSPTTQEDHLLETLRGEQYFGQYGKIVKIVVSKAKSSNPQQSVGVYVTFERKEDAAKCIAAVNGTANSGRVLRAQYGTTKYCSAYLRGDTCSNRNCMFLHEPGEDNESFSRQDLSSMNSLYTQQPQAHAQAAPQPPPPPQQAPHSIATASQPQAKDGLISPSETMADGPALPSTANWGNKAAQAQQAQDRRASHETTASAPSPLPSAATPQNDDARRDSADTQPSPDPHNTTLSQRSPSTTSAPRPQKPRAPELDRIMQVLSDFDLTYRFSFKGFTDQEAEVIKNFPPLWDPNGGAKMAARKEREAEERRRREAELQNGLQAAPPTEQEEANPEGGSLQLGGEPEERPTTGFGQGQYQAIQPPSQGLGNAALGLGQNLSLTEDFGNLNLRGAGGGNLSQQQQQQLLLLKSANPQSANLLNSFGSNQQQQPPFNQTQAPGGSGTGHTRHQSRFTFANDSSSASTAVKPVANAKLMNQQSSMMPQNTNQFGQNQLNSHFYTSGVQGPPPGLKTTGTPPVSGGGMFGQGHGFATGGLGYGANAATRNPNEDMMRDLLRTRGTGVGGGQVGDTGKREYNFPSFLHQHHPSTSTPAPAPGLLSLPYGTQPGNFQDAGPQKQKKKGKKHRHANTSSSSGGGVVDVADPSILQARLHQGNGMPGQGPYGGQGQDDEQAADPWQIDTLQQTSANPSVPSTPFRLDREPSRRSTPTIPPGFSATTGSGRSTPTVPPGFTLPSASGLALSRPQSRASGPPITPAVPNLPVAPMSKKEKAAAKAEKSHVSPKKEDQAMGEKSEAATDLKSNIAKTLSDVTNEKSKAGKGAKTRKSDSEPAKKGAIAPGKPTTESSSGFKDPSEQGSGQHLDEPKTLPSNEYQKSKSQPQTSKLASMSTKRQHPGKLDITAAVSGASQEEAASSAAASATTKDESSARASGSGSVAATPAAVSTGSPMKRTQPRTLRVVATPKTETPPAIPTQPSSSGPLSSVPGTAAAKIPSRAPSLASINPPGTPVSELISENASITSTSASRASSPVPGGKVGSAPIKKSKSQAKKERQERKRQIEEKMTEEIIAPPVDEPVQAPIIGRKKKSKKPAAAPTGNTAASTPIISRPPSPSQKDSEKASEAPTEERKATPPIKDQRPEPPTEQPPAAQPTKARSPSPPPKPPLTAASILKDLCTTGTLSQKSLADTIFHTPVNPGLHNPRPDTSAADLASLGIAKAYVSLGAYTDALDAAKASGYAVRLGGENGHTASRDLFTPAGMHLRGLTKEQEDRYLELEASVTRNEGLAKWTGGKNKAIKTASATDKKPQVGNITISNPARSRASSVAFRANSELGPEALARAQVRVQEKVNKKLEEMMEKGDERPAGGYVDETLNYVNQFILPDAETPSSARSGAVPASAAGGKGGSVKYASGVPSSVAGTAGVAKYKYNADIGESEALKLKGLGLKTEYGLGGASLGDIEKKIVQERRECERLEKGLTQLIKRNRRAGMNWV